MTLSNYIRLQSVSGVGPKKIQVLLAGLKQGGQSLDQLFEMTPNEIQTKFKLSKSLAEAIIKSGIPSESLVKQITDKGIKILILGSSDYPERVLKVLGADAPPILYVWGNLDLLKKPSVGFCGSRDVTEKGLEVTSDTACQIAEKDWVVVSGHARGVDSAAHQSAMQCGSGTIIVAPQG